MSNGIENESEVAAGHAHGDHPAFLAHHFHDAPQQKSAVKFGMWLFLVQEILFFAGLFMAYFAFRALYPETWLAAHELLDKRMGAFNTVVLLTSSLTMALAVRACQLDDIKGCVRYLWITIGCAFGFMIVKYFEYSHKFHEGLLPGRFYTHAGDVVPGQFLFFSFYFMMTGLHGIHVAIGMAAILVLLRRAYKGHFSAAYFGPVEITGLYWHLVDIIWIYLFPLMYLIS